MGLDITAMIHPAWCKGEGLVGLTIIVMVIPYLR
jgi:hypothetical protein